MIPVPEALQRVLPIDTDKPLAIILAGHNGSGKSTLWRRHVSDEVKIPLVNADRMMLSILPEPDGSGRLSDWATSLRDTDVGWMEVAQKGVEGFVAQAIARRVPFAMETVFSHWVERSDGTVESKIQLIEQLQAEGYFVLLLFVGLANAQLSIARVATRVEQGGHAVDPGKLESRFPRTQKAIRNAMPVADAAILTDNSRSMTTAFTVCRIQMKQAKVFDLRDANAVPPAIRAWLDVVCP